jgi:hypothetical protein
VKSLELSIEFGRPRAWQAIAPYGDQPAGGEHTLHFLEERRERQPVQRLCDGDDIGRPIRQPTVLGRRHAVLNPGVREGMRELTRTRVGPDDLLVVLRQAPGGLAVSSRTIPRENVPHGVCGEPVEEGIGVRGPKRGVVCRALREVVVELSHLAPLSKGVSGRFAGRARRFALSFCPWRATCEE